MEQLVDFLLIPVQLESPESVGQEDTGPQANRSEFGRAFSCRQHGDSEYQRGQGGEDSNEDGALCTGGLVIDGLGIQYSQVVAVEVHSIGVDVLFTHVCASELPLQQIDEGRLVSIASQLVHQSPFAVSELAEVEAFELLLNSGALGQVVFLLWLILTHGGDIINRRRRQQDHKKSMNSSTLVYQPFTFISNERHQKGELNLVRRLMGTRSFFFDSLVRCRRYRPSSNTSTFSISLLTQLPIDTSRFKGLHIFFLRDSSRNCRSSILRFCLDLVCRTTDCIGLRTLCRRFCPLKPKSPFKGSVISGSRQMRLPAV